MNNRDFKGVWIPKEIWLNKGLSIIEKCLLVEIDSLDNDVERGCFASNEYLGDFIGVSPGRAANIITDLKKRKFIQQVFFDGRNRGLRVHENVKAGKNLHENVKAAFTETLELTSQKSEQSNTGINTDENIHTTPREEKPSIDWKEVARRMTEHANGEGREDWKYMTAMYQYSGPPQEVMSEWACKATPYQLQTWKDYFPKLLPWVKKAAQGQLRQKTQGYQTVQPAPNTTRIHRKNRAS